MGENGELSTKQQRAIAALLTAKNIGAACEVAEVGRSTLTRWMDDPGFITALRRVEAQALDAAGRRLVGLADEAIETVRAIMEDDTMPPAVRLRAAGTVLDTLFKIRELAGLEQRVSRLEDLQHENRKTY